MLSDQIRKLEQENQELKEALGRMNHSVVTKGEKPRDCEHCEHYLQHYIRRGVCYYPTYDGHCTAGRVKNRKTDDTCRFFTMKE